MRSEEDIKVALKLISRAAKVIRYVRQTYHFSWVDKALHL